MRLVISMIMMMVTIRALIIKEAIMMVIIRVSPYSSKSFEKLKIRHNKAIWPDYRNWQCVYMNR